MSGTMRAAVITAPRTTRVADVPLPEPKAGEVRVRLEGCGICGSDFVKWDGRDWFDYPLKPGEPGHEGWGWVDAVADDVSGLAPRVRVTGLFQQAYGQFVSVPAARVVALPSDVQGHFPGEPLACAVNAFRRADVKPDHAVAVVGVGFQGALLTALSAHVGARTIAISRRAYALKVGESMGAAHAIEAGNDEAVVQEVERLAGGLCDRVFEATGLEAPLRLAAKLTRTRGRLVIAGYHQDGLRTVDMQLWNWRGLDVVNAHERDAAIYLEGMREAVRLVREGALDVRSLYTHTFDLDRLDAAFTMMRERPDGFLKAVVIP